MTVKSGKKRRGRRTADMENFLCYVPPKTFSILNRLWGKMGFASRAEMCRKVLCEFAEANEHLVTRAKPEGDTAVAS